MYLSYLSKYIEHIFNSLSDSAKDWETYDQMRSDINEPIEKLEGDLKKYRKFYDPAMFSKKLASKKQVWEECKTKCDETLAVIKKCYSTIMVLAGDEKKEFLDKEVRNVGEYKWHWYWRWHWHWR